MYQTVASAGDTAKIPQAVLRGIWDAFSYVVCSADASLGKQIFAYRTTSITYICPPAWFADTTGTCQRCQPGFVQAKKELTQGGAHRGGGRGGGEEGEEREGVCHARRVAIGQHLVVHAFPARAALMQGYLGLLSVAPVLLALSRRLNVTRHVRHVPPARTQQQQAPPPAHRVALETTPPSLG